MELLKRLISFLGIAFNIIKQEYKIALPSYFTDQGKEAKYWEFQVTFVLFKT